MLQHQRYNSHEQNILTSSIGKFKGIKHSGTKLSNVIDTAGGSAGINSQMDSNRNRAWPSGLPRQISKISSAKKDLIDSLKTDPTEKADEKGRVK